MQATPTTTHIAISATAISATPVAKKLNANEYDLSFSAAVNVAGEELVATVVVVDAEVVDIVFATTVGVSKR